MKPCDFFFFTQIRHMEPESINKTLQKPTQVHNDKAEIENDKCFTID